MATKSVFLRLAFAMCALTLLASAASAQCPPGWYYSPAQSMCVEVIIEGPCGTADPCPPPPPNQGQCPTTPPPPCDPEGNGDNCNQNGGECEAVPVRTTKDGNGKLIIERRWVRRTRAGSYKYWPQNTYNPAAIAPASPISITAVASGSFSSSRTPLAYRDEISLPATGRRG